MRVSRLLPSVCSATLFLACGLCGQEAGPAAATADDIPVPALAPPSHQPRPLTPQEEEILKRYDTNGDGKIDADELAAAHEATQPQGRGRGAIARTIYGALLARFDLDHRGRLNAEEQQRAAAFLASVRPGVYRLLLKRFDKNGDGKLDSAELATMFATLATFSGPPLPAAKQN